MIFHLPHEIRSLLNIESALYVYSLCFRTTRLPNGTTYNDLHLYYENELNDYLNEIDPIG